MTRLTELLGDIQHCRQCEADLPLGARPVLQCSAQASILIAGQAPGHKVHSSGIPFDDPSGDRLRDWMGIDRNVFYDASRIAIVPMGFCFPGTGKSGDLPPRPECAARWREPLLGELPGLRLTLVLGQYAQNWHLESKSTTLTECVRNWRDHWPQVLPLPHPSPRNNRWLKQNLWFASELLPELKARVTNLLQQPQQETNS